MGKKKQSGKSILTYILIPFCILTIVESLVFFGTIIIGGVRTHMEKNARDIVRERISTRLMDLQTDMLASWTNIDELETYINDMAETLEQEGAIDLSSIDSDSEAAEPLLNAVSDNMVSTLRSLRVNSIYIILNTSDSQQTQSNKPGLYILDQDADSSPSRRNQDLLIERGSQTLVKKLGIATAVNWKPNFLFETDGAFPDFVYKPSVAKVNGSYTDSRDLGYWSMTRALLGDKEDTLTYSVPLKTRDGKTYGILGVGITASHLKNTLPNAEIHESGKGGYCLAIRDGDSDNYRVVYSDENCVQNGEVLQLQPGANTYRISDEQEEVYISAQKLGLYNRNTPYESERWYLLGMVPEKNLMEFSNRIYLTLMFAMLLMVIVGVFGGIGVSLRLSTPIKKLYMHMEKSAGRQEENLPKTNISEIDHLVTQIEILNHELNRDKSHIIIGLTRDFQNVYLVTPAEDIAKTIKLENDAVKSIDIDSSGTYSFREMMSCYVKNRVYDEDSEKILFALSSEGIAQNLADRDEYSQTYRIIENGDIHYCQVKIIRAQQNGQYIIGFQNIDSLILEEKRQQKLYEEALSETQKAYEEVKRANVAKTNFLSRMSHDIRTPINGIVGMTHIMETEIDSREVVEDSLQKIKILSHQLELLINDVLEMGRIESGKFSFTHEVMDISENMKEITLAIQVMAEERGVTFTGVHFDIEHKCVVSSPVHIQRIVMNILSNAVKYNLSGGTVDFNIEERSVDDSHSSYVFTVRDTGMGMSQEFLKRIYEPFSREQSAPETTYSGTGLGMAITKELVDRLDGTINISSKQGVGTTVTIKLPLELSDEVPAGEVKAENVSLENKRILLVEDNKVNLRIAKYMLEEEKALVDVARNGQEAVDMFSENKVGRYDLILMDIMMPVMNGLDATKAIRDLDRADAKTVPIIAMTANAFAEDVARCKEAGMNEHIAKPIDIVDMKTKIARSMRKSL